MSLFEGPRRIPFHLHFLVFFLFFLTFYLNLASSNQEITTNKRPCIRIQNGAPKASVDLIARLAAAAEKPSSEGKCNKKKSTKVGNSPILGSHFVEVTKYCGFEL